MTETAKSPLNGAAVRPDEAHLADSRIAESVRAAQKLAAGGKPAEAEQMFAQVLELDPGQRDALNFLGMRNIAARNWDAGLGFLRRALQAHPGDALSHHNLGMAQEAMGDFAAALACFGAALAAAPGLYVSRLHYGLSCERLGHADAALRHHYLAIRTAQQQGQWLNPASTAPSARPLVEHALRLVEQGRQQLVAESLRPLREEFGADALGRVQACVAHYFGTQPADYPDPRQRPKFLFFPGLPTSPYQSTGLLPWIESLEAQTGTIREELLSLLDGASGREAVFQSQALAQSGLRNPSAEPVWDGYYFYRHGVRKAENCERCPNTFAAIGLAPLVQIRDHAPEIMFSVLSPGTHLLPHRGDTNIRSVVHLPLIVPQGCALNVGGELHEWREGRCVAFDDTYEHEAWNRGDSTRVVLILDAWNPHLTEVERLAVTRLIESIGDFNRDGEAAQLLPAPKSAQA